MHRAAACLVVLGLLIPAPLLAQEPSSDETRVDRLPVSLDRIKRGLREEQERSNAAGLKISYFITVVGENPRIDLFKDFDTTHGPVPFTAPTHNELFAQILPQAFSAPSANVFAGLAWLGSKISKKNPDDSK